MTSKTEKLRRMLDKRGVEWMPVAWNPKRETFYHAANGVGFCADEYTDGVKIYTDATITPEQAIAATLGRSNVGRYVGLRRGEYWERTENGDYYCGGCGWKVTDHDSYCPECGGALHEYALGTGTCHVESSIIDTYEYNRWEYELSCGHTIIWEDNEPPNYCPNCGRRCVG